MKQIRFSHSYPKLHGQKKAELLAVHILDAAEIQKNQDLIEYDTWWEEIVDNKPFSGYYPLPKTGKLIQLIFIGDKHIPFCTLRSYNPTKHKYYLDSIGESFEVI